MPDLLKILLGLFAGLAVLIWVAGKNPVQLTEEQQARMSKWIMILIGLIMIASAIKYFTGS